MIPIDISSFISFCKTLVGQRLDTIGGKYQFILSNITDNAFYYQVSDEKTRKQAIRYIERVLSRYAKTQSINPGHYADITNNAAYLLTLIRLYVESQEKGAKNP